MTRTEGPCILLVLVFGAAGVTSVVLMLRAGRDVAAPGPSKVEPLPSSIPAPVESQVQTPVETQLPPATLPALAEAVLQPVAPVPQAPAGMTPQPKVGANSAVTLQTFTPDAKLIVVLSDGSTWFSDLVSGARQAIGAKLDVPTAIAFTPDGKGIVTINAAGELKFLDSKTWLANETFATKVVGVKDVAFSPDGRSVALAGNGVVVWDVHDRKASRTLHSGQPCTSVSYSPDGRQLLTASPAGATFWETNFWQKEPGVPANDTIEARFWPGRNVFVTLSADGTIRIFDRATRRVQTTRMGGGRSVRAMTLSPDGRTIVTAEADGLSVWDSASSAVRMLK